MAMKPLKEKWTNSHIHIPSFYLLSNGIFITLTTFSLQTTKMKHNRVQKGLPYVSKPRTKDPPSFFSYGQEKPHKFFPNSSIFTVLVETNDLNPLPYFAVWMATTIVASTNPISMKNCINTVKKLSLQKHHYPYQSPFATNPIFIYVY